MEQIVTTLNIEITVLSLAVLMLVAWVLGQQMGRRLVRETRAKPSKFDDASMALLGLLLAFTFGMSIGKHDQRRLAIVADSNAIGDLYTCASLVKDPIGPRLQALIQRYTQLRLELPHGQFSSSALQRALAKSDRLHAEMTELVAQAVAVSPIAVPLTNALNAVVSSQASRLAAYRDRLPGGIVVLLFVCAIVTSMLIGREQGAAESSDIAGTLCFILLVTLAVYVTLELNRPEAGLIRASQEPLERLLSSMSHPVP